MDCFRRVLCLFLCFFMLLPCMTTMVFASETTVEASRSAATIPEGSIHAPGSSYQGISKPSGEKTVFEMDYTLPTATKEETQTYSVDEITSYKAKIKVDKGELDSGVKTKIVNGVSQMSVSVSETTPSKSFFQSYDESCLLITAVVNFESFPKLIEGSTYKHPLSLITWNPKTTSHYYLRFVCVDEEGYLYDSNRNLISESARLTAGKDTEISIVMDMDKEKGTCGYDLYVDGSYMFSGAALGVPTGELTSSTLRFFDNQRNYTAYLRRFSVQTVNPDYKRGEIPTANWTAYQTSSVTLDETGREVYDLRLISLLGSRKHAEVGYELIAAYTDESGNIVVKRHDETTDTVYTSLNQTVNGVVSEWKAEDNGGGYILAFAINDIYADIADLELMVRPYALSGSGNKVYGKASYLKYEGLGDDGLPVFSESDLIQYTGTIASEDTYVRFGTGKELTTIYGNADRVEIKYNRPNTNVDPYAHANTRSAFLKFELEKLPKNAAKYELSLWFEAACNVPIKVVAIDPDSWDESTLTGALVKEKGSSMEMGWSRETDHVAQNRPTVDVTEWVKQAIQSGANEVSFRLDFTEYNAAYAAFYSREYEDGSFAATLSAGDSKFNYDINLTTLNNRGYEPWSYAEKMVEDWWTNIQKIYAVNYTDATVGSDKNGNDYTTSIMITDGNLTPSNWTNQYLKPIRTVSSISGFTALDSDDAVKLDRYGGLAADGGKYYSDVYSELVNGKKGHFGTYYDTENDRWWYITPEGNRFLAVGVCSVKDGMTTAHKALAAKVCEEAGKSWDEWVSDMFNEYGINAANGVISHVYDETAIASGKHNISTYHNVNLNGKYAESLNLNSSVGGATTFKNNNTLNVFDPDFIKFSYGRAMAETANADDPYCMGYVSDNELPADKDMLDRYLRLDPSDPLNTFSYAAAWTWLRFVTGEANPSIDVVASAEKVMNIGGVETAISYRELFRGFVYYRYYAVASGALKSAAPHKLYLGCRSLAFNYQSEAVVRVKGYFSDVMTANIYLGADPDASVVANLHKWGGKPLFVTEFYSKSAGTDAQGNETGTQAYAIWEYQDADGNTQYCPADGKTRYVDAEGNTQTAPKLILNNTCGGGKVVLSQKDRGTYYQTFALKMLESGYCIGWAWHRFLDNDMTIYWDTKNEVYVENTTDLQKMAATGTLDTEQYVVVHQGETDQSALDSNKGLISNGIEIYTDLAESVRDISRNMYAIAEFFDATRR